MLGRSSPHPLQNSPQVLSIFAPICAFTRKFRRGSSRLRGVQLTCNPEPSPRLKREKSGASLGPTLYLVSGRSPRCQRLPILRATSPHWAGPAGSGRGLPGGAHAPRPSLLPRLGVPGPGSKRGRPSPLHRRGLRLPGFGLWPRTRTGVCCLLPDLREASAESGSGWSRDPRRRSFNREVHLSLKRHLWDFISNPGLLDSRQQIVPIFSGGS